MISVYSLYITFSCCKVLKMMLCDVRDDKYPELQDMFHDVPHRIVPTNGNGKCALHARFGVVAADGLLQVQNVRAFIDHLAVVPIERSRPYTQLYESLDAESLFFFIPSVLNFPLF